MWAGAPTSETGRHGSLGSSHGARAGFLGSDSARPEKPGHRSRDDEPNGDAIDVRWRRTSATTRPGRAALLATRCAAIASAQTCALRESD
jgi:hypothetical protein